MLPSFVEKITKRRQSSSERTQSSSHTGRPSTRYSFLSREEIIDPHSTEEYISKNQQTQQEPSRREESQICEISERKPYFSYTPLPYESRYYRSLFQFADERGSIHEISREEAVSLFALSLIPANQLSIIWVMADYDDTNVFTSDKFNVAVRLIQLYQNNQEVKSHDLKVDEHVILKPAIFEGVSGAKVPLPKKPNNKRHSTVSKDVDNSVEHEKTPCNGPDAASHEPIDGHRRMSLTISGCASIITGALNLNKGTKTEKKLPLPNSLPVFLQKPNKNEHDSSEANVNSQLKSEQSDMPKKCANCPKLEANCTSMECELRETKKKLNTTLAELQDLKEKLQKRDSKQNGIHDTTGPAINGGTHDNDS